MTTRDYRALRHMLDVIVVLVGRDQKSRYRTTAMGVFWAIASPVLFLLTFYLLFKVILPLNIPRYAAHIFIGLVVWGWFQASVIEAVTCIVGNGGLLKQPGFPVAALPVAVVTSNLLTLLLTLPLLIVILLFDGATIGASVICIPVLILCQYVFILSMAYLVAALNVVFRDMQYIVPILLQVGYFATPIFYDIASVSATAQGWLALNPMVGLVGAFRQVLIFGAWPDWSSIGLITALSFLTLLVTYRFFRGARLRFLEEI